ncbi:MAG: 30S ribosomal protein S26e [Candidatus Lokiarchaeota archaeon]|nr:30S ribosomal protein S26e [Candidatus Lokiarchaeota archaeon]
MPKKRKSSGKTGSNKGKHKMVQCNKCGRHVARSKAKIVRRRTNLVDGRMHKELRDSGTIIISGNIKKYLCISCAVHSGLVSQRAEDKRKE